MNAINNKLATATKLYHFTPESNLGSIRKEGLNTYERSGFCAYEGKRSFFWVELFTPALDNTLSLLLDERGKYEKYILLEIDLSLLDKEKIFNDSAVCGHLAVYTDQHVPSEAITVKGDLFNFF